MVLALSCARTYPDEMNILRLLDDDKRKDLETKQLVARKLPPGSKTSVFIPLEVAILIVSFASSGDGAVDLVPSNKSQFIHA
ncbi:MAG: hypothetical protein A3E84_03360 [Gammaproteobacteria bacterium RIFCSPHIGHO2_12_FULL_42_13]|nr:MAG: hypothetical protein A3E84_03360 [Gammaproteobacteria bacterium RIFCSPHIGHO2_12_FULL_42_13]